MALTITNFLPTPPSVFYTQGFVDTLESHIDYFKNHKDTQLVQLDPSRVYAHLGDFYGMLTEIGIEIQYQWFCMRLNGLFSTSDFTEDLSIIFVPSKKEIDRLRVSYNIIGKLKM
jgi:hypothetical protein